MLQCGVAGSCNSDAPLWLPWFGLRCRWHVAWLIDTYCWLTRCHSPPSAAAAPRRHTSGGRAAAAATAGRRRRSCVSPRRSRRTARCATARAASAATAKCACACCSKVRLRNVNELALWQGETAPARRRRGHAWRRHVACGQGPHRRDQAVPAQLRPLVVTIQGCRASPHAPKLPLALLAGSCPAVRAARPSRSHAHQPATLPPAPWTGSPHAGASQALSSEPPPPARLRRSHECQRRDAWPLRRLSGRGPVR